MSAMRNCPFCGEVHKLKVVLKWMRGNDWRDRRPAGYVQCQKCKARGPLFSTTYERRQQVYDDAINLWNGLLRKDGGAAGLPLFAEGGAK